MTFLDEIDAFLKANDMSPTAFGMKSLNDPPFVAQVRKGRRVWPETMDKVRSFMKDHEAESQASEAA